MHTQNVCAWRHCHKATAVTRGYYTGLFTWTTNPKIPLPVYPWSCGAKRNGNNILFQHALTSAHRQNPFLILPASTNTNCQTNSSPQNVPSFSSQNRQESCKLFVLEGKKDRIAFVLCLGQRFKIPINKHALTHRICDPHPKKYIWFEFWNKELQHVLPHYLSVSFPQCPYFVHHCGCKTPSKYFAQNVFTKITNYQ